MQVVFPAPSSPLRYSTAPEPAAAPESPWARTMPSASVAPLSARSNSIESRGMGILARRVAAFGPLYEPPRRLIRNVAQAHDPIAVLRHRSRRNHPARRLAALERGTGLCAA